MSSKRWLGLCLLLVSIIILAWPTGTIAQVPPPPAPKALSPGAASEPGPEIDTLTPTLKWTAVSGADYYNVALSDDFGNTIFNPQQVTEIWAMVNSGVLKPVLKPGHKLHWAVQAHGPGGWSSPSNTLFFQIQPSLKVDCNGSGSVSPQGCGTTQLYPQNKQLTLTATPASGWQFTGWSGACLGTGICQVTVDYSKSVTATFAQVLRPPAPTALSPGSTSKPGPETDTVQPTLNWSAVSGADYYNVAVIDSSGNTAFNPQQVTGTSVAVPNFTLKPGLTYRWAVQAHGPGGWSSPSDTLFFQIQPSLKVDCNGSGSVSPQGCGTTQLYPQNKQLTLKATPASGWQFMGWSGACLGGICQVTVDYSKSVTATFTQVVASPTPTKQPQPPTQLSPSPQPTPSSLPAAQSEEYIMLFADDFESGQAQAWATRGPVGGEWSVQEKGGNHFLDIKGNIGVGVGVGSSWTDYILRVKVALLEGEASINFRQQSKEPGGTPDFYQLLISRYDLRLNKVRRVESSKTQATLLGSAPVELKLGTWYSVSIEANGNQFTIQVDGIPKLKLTDPQEPLLNGAFTLTSSGLAGSHALYDDVWVGRIRAPTPQPTPVPPAPPLQPLQPLSPVQPEAHPTPAPGPSPPPSLIPSLSVETLSAIMVIVTGIGTIAGWLISRRVAGRKRRHLQKLLDEIDTIYTQFKMNSRRCEAELYRLKDIIVEQLKAGAIEEQTYTILEKRLDSYMKEIQERIVDEKLGGFPSKLRNSLTRMLRDGAISEEEFNSMEKLLSATTELSEEDKAELRESLGRWRDSYLKKDEPGKDEPSPGGPPPKR